MASVRHTKVSTVPPTANPDLVSSDDWNDDHDLTDVETVTGSQAKVDVHKDDTSAAHAATAVAFTPAGTIAATTVQAAIEEVASEAGSGSGFTLADVLISDDFDRADAVSLGSPWTSAQHGIAGNEAYYSNASDAAAVAYRSGAADCTITCDITLSATAAAAGIALRHNGTYYMSVVLHRGTLNEVLVLKTASGYNSIADGTPNFWNSPLGGLTLGTTYTMQLVATGASIAIYLKVAGGPTFTLIGTYALTTTTTSGRPAENSYLLAGTGVGIAQRRFVGNANSDEGDSTFDNWSVSFVAPYDTIAVVDPVDDGTFDSAPPVGTFIGSYA